MIRQHSRGNLAALLTAAAVCWLAPAPAGAQPPARTAAGHPDIQGIWVNFDRTPLEVPIESDAGRLAALEHWFPGLEVTAQGCAASPGRTPADLPASWARGTAKGTPRSAARCGGRW